MEGVLETADECPECSNQFTHAKNCSLNPDNIGESLELQESPKDQHNNKLEKWSKALKYADEHDCWSIVQNVAEGIEEAKI